MMVGIWRSKSEVQNFLDWECNLNLDDRDKNFRWGESEFFHQLTGLRAHDEISTSPTEVAFGLYYSDMKDNETKKTFENRIKKSLSKLFKEDIKQVEICTSQGYN